MSQKFEDRCTQLSSRINEISAITNSQHTELSQSMKRNISGTKEAVTVANAAHARVDERLHESVHKASQALKMQVETIAAATARHSECNVQDLESGLLGLIARESLSAELKIMVDRAIQRLQVVSDDVAQRSATFQQCTSCDLVYRQRSVCWINYGALIHNAETCALACYGSAS